MYDGCNYNVACIYVNITLSLLIAVFYILVMYVDLHKCDILHIITLLSMSNVMTYILI